MRAKHWCLALAAGVGLLGASYTASAQEQLIPSMVYRTGPFAPSGTPTADGFADYIALLNNRDGGLNGVKLKVEECETQYNTERGVECYERLKAMGGTIFSPYSTGITYALIDRAPTDKSVIFSMAYGRASAMVGNIFPWVFNAPVTYWSGASAAIQFFAKEAGGKDKLKGKKIAHVFIDIPYGKEPQPGSAELCPGASVSSLSWCRSRRRAWSRNRSGCRCVRCVRTSSSSPAGVR